MKRSSMIIAGLVILAIVAGGVYLISGNDDQQIEENSKVWKVGILSGSPIFDTAIATMQQELNEAGFIEGKNIEYEIQSADGDETEMARISQEYVDKKVDMIISTTNAGAIAAQKATVDTDIPVVFMFVIAPVQAGIVSDLNDIDNVTGVRNPLEDFVGRRLELLQSIDPTATRIWAPYNSAYDTVQVVTAKLGDIAPGLALDIVYDEISTPEEVVAHIDNYKEGDELPFDAIFIFPDLTVQQSVSWTAIRDFAEANDLPILANTPAQVQEGALFSYLADNNDTGRQAARQVILILNGTNVNDLPIETAELSLMINLDAATRMGLDVSDDILNQANVIIREETE